MLPVCGFKLNSYVADLESLAGDHRLRSLKPRAGIDFTSNDYLALSNAPRIKRAVTGALEGGTPLGAGGSRLLRGNCGEHEALEADAARVFRADTSLSFGSGYIANYSILTTLPQRGDLLVLDSLVHARGARAGRASYQLVGHNEPQMIEDAIRRWRAQGGIGRVWIVVESLYSMDGDFAPLKDLVGMADRYDAFLLIDEAHATGVYGDHGRGLAALYEGRENLLVVHTCGKALGAAGALVTASGVLRDFMVNRCRPFIFATAPSPVLAIAVREALLVLEQEPQLQERLASLVAEMRLRGWRNPSASQIVPHLVGDNARTMQLASRLQARGFDIRGIRPPTVPEGTARLRLSLTLNVVEDEMRAMLDALFEETTGEALANCLGANYWKPVQAGLEGETDAQLVERLGCLDADRIIPELYRLQTPASPHHSAELEGIRIDTELLKLPNKSERPLVIEGAGGVMVPLSYGKLFIDVFEQWQIPIVLCASTRLGTINHSLLSLEALRKRQIRILGIAFIGERNPESESAICEIGRARWLGRLPWLSPLTSEALQLAFKESFLRDDFLTL